MKTTHTLNININVYHKCGVIPKYTPSMETTHTCNIHINIYHKCSVIPKYTHQWKLHIHLI